MELELPATEYEMLDLMEQLRLKPGQIPYLEILEFYDYEYLAGRIQELPDVFQLNTLAKRLAELEIHGMAAFEGLVSMELQKGGTRLSILHLIDFAYSEDCCHVVEDPMTDCQLGRFFAENGFVPEADQLSDAAFELLDFAKIGKEHRESESGVFTGFGYVERHEEPRKISGTLNFQPHKPPYTVLLSLAHESKAEPILIRLPASSAELREALSQLGTPDWKDAVSTILDCPVPSMNKRLFLEEEIPLVIEWAEALGELDKSGSLPKYKALLSAADCGGIAEALRLTNALDEYEFAPTLQKEDDVASAFLAGNLSGSLLQTVLPHIHLQALGRSLLETSNGALTPYGSISRVDGQPIQNVNDQPRQGGMEMNG